MFCDMKRVAGIAYSSSWIVSCIVYHLIFVKIILMLFDALMPSSLTVANSNNIAVSV